MRNTEVCLPKYGFLQVHDTLTFLGSCFSEHIAESTRNIGFNVLSNPFGVVFNPISLADQLLFNDNEWKLSIFQVSDKFLSWNASALIWGLNRDSIESELSMRNKKLHDHILKSSVLFVTFGSAWVYELDEKSIVANCHKQPQTRFNKRCLVASEIVSKWKNALTQVKALNPNLRVVFTVSPVRHKKDGLVENNLSKSILLSSVHELVELNENCFYFPSYEIVIDELRDYAYFERDGVHPNRYAIEEVEDRFLKCFLSNDASSIIEEFRKLKSLLSHRVLHEGSQSALQHNENKVLKKDDFLARHSGFKSLLK